MVSLFFFGLPAPFLFPVDCQIMAQRYSKGLQMEKMEKMEKMTSHHFP